MNKGKKLYTKNEVDAILSETVSDYEEKIAELKSIVANLTEINSNLSARLDEYKDKEELIFDAIKNATESAENIKREAEKKYAAEAESLRSFSVRWREYFSYLYKKYPLYDKVKEAKEVFDKLSYLLVKAKDRKVVEEFSTVLDGVSVPKSPFDPMKKINEYVAATSENGFNLDEVLNPGELQLEDLCKELGLIGEEN